MALRPANENPAARRHLSWNQRFPARLQQSVPGSLKDNLGLAVEVRLNHVICQ